MPQADRRPALAALFVFFLSLPSPTGALSTEAPAPPSVEFGELYRARSCLDERPLIKGYFRRCTTGVSLCASFSSVWKHWNLVFCNRATRATLSCDCGRDRLSSQVA